MANNNEKLKLPIEGAAACPVCGSTERIGRKCFDELEAEGKVPKGSLPEGLLLQIPIMQALAGPLSIKPDNIRNEDTGHKATRPSADEETATARTGRAFAIPKRLAGGKAMTAVTEIEIKELEKAKDGLEEAIAKLREVFKRIDRYDEDSDLFLEAINMVESVREEYLGAWLEEFEMQAREDRRKLEAWKLWATR